MKKKYNTCISLQLQCRSSTYRGLFLGILLLRAVWIWLDEAAVRMARKGSSSRFVYMSDLLFLYSGACLVKPPLLAVKL